MVNQTAASHVVNANALFTLVDDEQKEHFVVAEPGRANGIDGTCPLGATHSGRLVFVAPIGKKLGLVLYGPRIGTQVSDFMIDPPTLSG